MLGYRNLVHLSEDLIKNGFDHIVEVGTETTAKEVGISERNTVNGMIYDGLEHSIEFTGAGLESSLSQEIDDYIIDEVSLEQLRRVIARLCDSENGDVIIEHPDDEADVCVAKELIGSARALSVLERCEKFCDDSKKLLEVVRLRCKLSRSLPWSRRVQSTSS